MSSTSPFPMFSFADFGVIAFLPLGYYFETGKKISTDYLRRENNARGYFSPCWLASEIYNVSMDKYGISGNLCLSNQEVNVCIDIDSLRN